ncbi:MAG: HIT domain-containing protein [Candidatus Omnitrophica bacterium]|nr:HIT domain-containing protein [Candidatus Omnitrophota bacterium]MBU1996313.1 HIT domain-containing protein [Candidatus Omnitrophota bacterium]MBU4334402.1 HIT domain-containing protein [Candidatus Omnitrophota bacterium]
MDKLWAPWRIKYITEDLKKSSGCVFCRIVKEKKDKQNFVVIRGKYCFAVLNIYPYNNGHTLIVTNRHVSDIDKLKKEERDEFFDLLSETKALIQKTISPSGFNIGMNLGKVAGAGFPGHLHMHIVPRWPGDVNFMPVVSGTKVISQSLKTLHKELCDVYKRKN